ncbi:hypothetical protein Syun_011263 [Stephania yunnanensis]|uniref:Pentatricopeptide repeat-containing protein n=1 Tax=Stephania yunnanensis TaxID=152371 RepID=A0AAP0PE93_9MAGN
MYRISRNLLSHIHNFSSSFQNPRLVLASFPLIQSPSLSISAFKLLLSNVLPDRCVDDADEVCKIIVENHGADRSIEAALDLVGIELSTELVNNVLQKLHFEEKLAFRFFMWAGRQEHYAHQSETYNQMIDILSSTKYKVKQFRIVCDMLDYMKRNDRNSVPVEVLLVILRKYTEKHLSYLQKFTRKKKIRVKTQPEINAFNLLLDALCKCSLVEEGEVMFKKLKKNNKVVPDANTYNILFFGWCRVRNPARAMRVLEEMIEMSHVPDNFTYNTAIDSFCRVGMVSEAVELFDFMRSRGSTMSSPTAKTYVIMIVALARSDKMEECRKLIDDMSSTGSLPDVSTYKELIEGLCLAGKIEEAYKFLEEMGNKGYPCDIVTYNCFLKVMVDFSKAYHVLRLFEFMLLGDGVCGFQQYNFEVSAFYCLGQLNGLINTQIDIEKSYLKLETDLHMKGGLFGIFAKQNECHLLQKILNKDKSLWWKMLDYFCMQLSKTFNLNVHLKLTSFMWKMVNSSMFFQYARTQIKKGKGQRVLLLLQPALKD